MGTGGYKGGAAHYHSIGENADGLKRSYKFNSSTGYFGEHGQSSKASVRNISSDDPVATAKSFYDQAAYGGIETSLGNGKGVKTEMSDGTTLTYREISSSDGSPAVDINISLRSSDFGGIKTQKIHFVMKECD